MTPAVDAAKRAKVGYRLIELDSRDGHPDGREAAAAMNVASSAVFKTLIVKVDGTRYVNALVPVSASLDLRALASVAGGKRAEMAEPDDAERATGFVVGGISPLGQRRTLQTFVDASITGIPRVYISAGRRGLELEMAPADLLALCNAALGKIAR